MYDPNGFFVGEDSDEPLLGFDLSNPIEGHVSNAGEIIDNVGEYTPNALPGSNARLAGYLSTIPAYPSIKNKVSIAHREKSSDFVVITIPPPVE